MKNTLSEAAVTKVYRTLLERFGEPLQATVAESVSTCSQCGGMMSLDEATCSSCGSMPDSLDQSTPPGGEKVVRALKKDKDVENPWAVAWSMKDKGQLEGRSLDETRDRVSKAEVEQTWEDLYTENGQVSLEELASWLAAPEEIVERMLAQTYLIVDQDGFVVERGISTPPPPPPPARKAR